MAADYEIIIEGKLLHEAEILKKDVNKAIFKMILQTFDEENQNHRVYPEKVLKEAMRNCEEAIKTRAMYCELDHPPITGNSATDGVRQTTVLLEKASHLITDYEWQGNKLIGQMETLTTDYGKTLLSLLLDKTAVGMSMRGMAELDHRNNIKYVKSPLYIISFDAVSKPSHKAATIKLTDAIKYESLDYLQESKCGMICTPDGKCYWPNYIQLLIDKKIMEFGKSWY
jgi:hypothetical protein